MTLRSDERVRAAYSIAPKERSGCSWCNDTGEVGPLEDRYVCPCPAGELMQLKSKVRAGGVERTPEPHLQALIDRAEDWQSRMFDYEVNKHTPTRFETEAREIMSDLLLALSYSVPAEARGAVEPPAQEPPTMTDAAEMLWIVLANVSGGDWTKQSPEWQEAAARWRDNYFAALRGARPSPPPAEFDPQALIGELERIARHVPADLPFDQYPQWTASRQRDAIRLAFAGEPFAAPCDWHPKVDPQRGNVTEWRCGREQATSHDARDQFAVSPPPATPQESQTKGIRPQIRLLTCKRCGCSIDAGLCGYECDLDGTLPNVRKSEDMEVRVYDFSRAETSPAAPHGADTPGQETK